MIKLSKIDPIIVLFIIVIVFCSCLITWGFMTSLADAQRLDAPQQVTTNDVHVLYDTSSSLIPWEDETEIVVYQPEFNHRVDLAVVRVVSDTTSTDIHVIWFQGVPFVRDTSDFMDCCY